MQEMIDGLLFICPCVIANKDQREPLPSHEIIVKDDRFLTSLPKEETEDFTQIAVIQNEKTWRRFKNEVLIGLKNSDPVFLKKLDDGYEFSSDVAALNEKFDKPTLILTGRQDSIVGYKDAWKMVDNYPRCTYAVLDQAGHNLQIEQEGIFNTLVEEWLDRIK